MITWVSFSGCAIFAIVNEGRTVLDSKLVGYLLGLSLAMDTNSCPVREEDFQTITT